MADTYEPMVDSVSINSDIVETIIGEKTSFKGNVSTDKPLRIDGSFEGDIKSTDNVVISKNGLFKGTVVCSELYLEGTGEGEIVCSELLKFADSGKFKGDATTKHISIGEGSVFDGNLKMASN